jgi:hypothetical protein
MNARVQNVGRLALLIAKRTLFIALRLAVIALHVFAAFYMTGIYILLWAIYGVIAHARKARVT